MTKIMLRTSEIQAFNWRDVDMNTCIKENIVMACVSWGVTYADHTDFPLSVSLKNARIIG